MIEEIVFFYVDLGHPDYESLARAMVRSARNVGPDLRLCHLTDSKTAQIEGSTALGRFEYPVHPGNLMLMRTAIFAKHVRHTKGPSVFCDVDCLWLKKPDIAGTDWDVGVLYRAGQPGMPYVNCMVYTKPNERAIEFWADWAFTLSTLKPESLHGWWGDQIALALLLGLDGRPGNVISRKGCRIGILDAYEHAMIPSDKDQTVESAMIHFKGSSRKPLMEQTMEGDGFGILEGMIDAA